jgi:hypothetical protein
MRREGVDTPPFRLPFGASRCSVIMENDFGDPDKYKEKVIEIVKQVHEIGTEALAYIPYVGPALAKYAAPYLGSLMPDLGGAINDLMDFGDDRIGSGNVTISARQMVLLAARTGNSNWKGIGFKIESPLISGSGAAYKAYYGIVPA